MAFIVEKDKFYLNISVNVETVYEISKPNQRSEIIIKKLLSLFSTLGVVFLTSIQGTKTFCPSLSQSITTLETFI